MNMLEFKIQLIKKNKSVKDVAKILNISDGSLYKRIRGENDFKCHEAKLIKDYLNLSEKELIEIFFT